MDSKKTGRDRGDGATRNALLQKIAVDFPGNSTSSQQVRMWAAMQRAGSITTTEARLHLEVMHPAMRVLELRRKGVKIEKVWALEPSEAGRTLHRQARYVLLPHQGGAIAPELIALLLLAMVAGLLLLGVIA
ncbi:MAG: helix-turn-helix domain-containing protein [Hyphomicrobiaceae bacterium]|nr:helix-turn-helix domain-containing protein [Hyphomicrobiaceae bacterium]